MFYFLVGHGRQALQRLRIPDAARHHLGSFSEMLNQCELALAQKTIRRKFASTVIRAEVFKKVKPLDETEGVIAIDKLMTTIRQCSDSLRRTIMPMGSPFMWSESISAQAFRSPGNVSPSPQSETPMPIRSMQDSYSELLLPFRSNPSLLEQYTNAKGGLRVGKLMENLDSISGSIAYKHVLGPGVKVLGNVFDRGFYIVTAAVDRLDLLIPLIPENVQDLRLYGHVIYTGRSSMEIVVKMELLTQGGTEETLLLGRFSMVCRDAVTQKAKAVPPLMPSTPEEQLLFAMGEEHKQRRKSQALRSLDKVPPSSEEAAQLHGLFLQHKNESAQVGGAKRVWMKDTMLENSLLMFPQERNVHLKIFGGYLMRLAYELSFTTVAIFSRHPLRFLSLDGLSFRHPVPIGSILRLCSRITCTTGTPRYPGLVHSVVEAKVLDIEQGTELTTNEFRFTWCDEDHPLTRIVVPNSYEDAMEWVEAKRVLDVGDAIRRTREVTIEESSR